PLLACLWIGFEMHQCILAPQLAYHLVLRALFERQQPVTLAASSLPGVEQTEGVKPLVEQGQRVVRRARDKLFGQRHLVDGATLHDGLNKQVTGDRKSTRPDSSHVKISYAVVCVTKT